MGGTVCSCATGSSAAYAWNSTAVLSDSTAVVVSDTLHSDASGEQLREDADVFEDDDDGGASSVLPSDQASLSNAHV